MKSTKNYLKSILKVSEGLSELQEAEEYINTLETRSKALEAKITAFESENLKLKKKNPIIKIKIKEKGEESKEKKRKA